MVRKIFEYVYMSSQDPEISSFRVNVNLHVDESPGELQNVDVATLSSTSFSPSNEDSSQEVDDQFFSKETLLVILSVLLGSVLIGTFVFYIYRRARARKFLPPIG